MRVANVPASIKSQFEEFQDLSTKPSLDSMQHLSLAVINCRKSKNVMNLHESLSDDLRKSRTAYEYFFNKGKWSDVEVAQRKADVFLKSLKVGNGDVVLLVIDDTLRAKKGEKTDGVGKFYDYAKQKYIWGNSIVTSCIQYREHYIPHLVRLYIKEEDAAEMGEPFRTKLEIALEDIIEPLKVPKGVNVIVVFDSWWSSTELINGCLAKGYSVVCQLKSDRLVNVNGITQINGITQSVSELAGSVPEKDFRKVRITVRGKKKTYRAREEIVELPDVEKVKLVISISKKEANFYISTDVEMSKKEILETYENRWNIENYQIRGKRAIERFVQIVFLAWTILLVARLKRKNPRSVLKQMKLSELIDDMNALIVVEVVIKVFEKMKYGPPKEDIVIGALEPYL